MKMVPNPITEEIREIRHRLAAQFDNDVLRIGAETRRRQAASGRRAIRLPSRTIANRTSSQGTKNGVIAAKTSEGETPCP
jgi:hypothetical protein